jgi:drug/metabolite transporter (DMT)-like permease
LPLVSGSTSALLTALSWAVAIVLFRRSGDGMPPAALNYFKNTIGLLLFVLTFPIVGTQLCRPIPAEDVILLFLSGAVGIGVADTFLFHSLNLLGAGRSAIVWCLYSPSIVLFSFLFLDESLTWLVALGTLLVAGSIVLTGVERRSPSLSLGDLLEGVISGIAAIALMGLSIVVVKPVLELHPVLWSTTLRMFGGFAVLSILVLVSRKMRQQVAAAFRPTSVWRFALPGSIVGTYVALLFWIAGFKYSQAMTAGVLNQTSTLWVVLLATLFLKEKLTAPRLSAMLLGFAGSVLVLV